MRSSRKQPGIYHGVDTSSLEQEGAIVYPFDQYSEIQQTQFPDGLCMGFTASLMRRLSAGELDAPRLYTNPLPKPILQEAVALTYKAVELTREGQERDIDRLMFNGKRPRKTRVAPEEMSPYLSAKSKATTLTYSMKNGDKHVLSFFNKSTDECVIQDANRFTIEKCKLTSGKEILKEIIDRSKPDEVVVAFDPFRRSSL